MMQLKAIFSVLLQRYTFALTQPPDTYVNDHSKMVVQLAQPCGARMTPISGPSRPDAGRGRPQNGWRVVVDRDLCQGHGVCESEAPGVFSVSKDAVLTVLQEAPADSERAAVAAAVRYCPTHALTIVEDQT
jgi:sterol 14-demethylase